MAWTVVSITTDGGDFTGHQDGDRFSVPFAAGLKAGEEFKSGGTTRKVLTAVNFANRDEVLHLQTEMMADDKSKTRGNGAKTRKPKVASEGDDGQSGEGGDISALWGGEDTDETI
jgi:hypothetical protein